MATDPRAQFIEDVGAFLTEMGMPRMPSRVFALLLSSDEDTLTARELAERLEVSPAAISGAVRQLTQLQMVRRTRTPGERRDRFGVAEHVWESVMDLEHSAYAPLIRMCEQALENVDFADGPARRVAETREFLRFMLAEWPALAQRWRERREGLER